jgi:hypothetical protein
MARNDKWGTSVAFPPCYHFHSMSRRISAALIAAFLLWISTPALACLAKPEKMTEAEMQCCREMAGQCGAMAKAEHSCCPKTPVKAQTDKTILAVVEKYSAPITIVAFHDAIASFEVKAVPDFVARRLVVTAESPPGTLLPLRI